MRKPSRPTGEEGASIDSRLLARERRYLDRTRARRPRGAKQGTPAPVTPQLVSDRRDLCGLALSGGGMRSATFNLGLLQGLHQLGLLEMFDYLATVSGGGYIGGFWTAWRHYHGKRTRQGHAARRTWESRLFPTTTQGSRGAKLPEVSHLREFSNFLNPRLGLMSLDTGRLLVAALSAVLPALLAALSLLILAPLLWRQLARFLLVEWSPWDGPPPVGLGISYALMLLMTGGGLFFFEWLLARQNEQVRLARNIPPPSQEDAQELEFRRFGYYLPTALLAMGAVLLLWWGLVHGYHDRIGARREGPWPPEAHTGDLEPLYVFLPPLAWVGSIVLLVMLRWFGSRYVTEWMQRTKLAAVERVISRLLLLAILWSIFAALWVAGGRLHGFILGSGTPAQAYAGLAGAVTALTALLAKAHQFLGRQTSRPVSPSLKERVKAHLPKWLGYVTLALVALGMVLLIHAAEHGGWLTGLQVAAVTLTVLTLLLFDPNLVGLHVFYRGRIARTFIGAAHGEGPGQTEPHTKDDLPLDDLRPRPGPLHLICCAANDLSSVDPMANLYRGADSAVLSSVGFSVGKEWKSWKRLRKEGGTVPTLASAMTASGAAFNSHMGAVSMRLGKAVTFLMTAFNLRLGLWSPHPTRAHRRWYEQLFVGLPFYKELLGRSRARSRDVLLSDGGHFENLALYELVRRHCRFILVSDCGTDSGTTFDDFANAVRRVREDFGVELRIDLSPLRAAEGGLSRQPIVVGDIEYPDGDTGVLLLLKPTLTGNEPPDVRQYKARNVDFPHETTGDQFYDEAQWEAYRRLGEHAALTAFRPLREATERSKERAAQLFARARSDWMPVPEGYQERFSRFVARAAELDAMLQQQTSGRLFREVFKEINELDREAKEQAPMHGGTLRKRWTRHKTGDGDGHPEEFNPTPQELSEALHILRLALLFMEEVFLSEDLATHYNHPAYLGLMNYFARWAYSSLFRAWWPLLKTQYSPRFTYFLEKRFYLPPMDRKDIGRLSREEHGFAMSCWRHQRGRPARDETPEDHQTPRPVPLERLISYQLKMPCEGEPQYYIQAAQLIARTHHANGKPLLWDADGSGGRQVMVWQGDDFYVPPGLWGAGIREDFLRRITSSTELLENKAFDVSRGTLMAVRLLVDREASAARRHRWAEEVQFYRSHGFEEPGPELAQWLTTDIERELTADPALPWDRRADVHWLPYWLVRTYNPVEEPSPHPKPRPEREGAPLH
ncbi:MAG TPA: patatin-like phospholipase family protein [Archangium sp.]|uniref:patatin-like phospholipase family protein n=1 Tax=Archangium sp. TaxID=1872627 RepID=UPI002E34A5A0|nr:patatin-like phospholipase family protein [Archangium sp.]HEX5754619.1 patatin-like phospholipase family protein [Archangium sp.]